MSHTGEVNFRDKRYPGYITGNVYISDRKPGHVMIMYKGFGISTTILDSLLKAGVKTIRIIYKSNVLIKVYEYDIMQFILSDKQWIDKTTDGKDDVQKFVSLEEQEWEEIKDGLPYFKKKKKEDASESV